MFLQTFGTSNLKSTLKLTKLLPSLINYSNNEITKRSQKAKHLSEQEKNHLTLFRNKEYHIFVSIHVLAYLLEKECFSFVKESPNDIVYNVRVIDKLAPDLFETHFDPAEERMKNVPNMSAIISSFKVNGRSCLQ
jgi:hypothetical protein